VIATDPEPDLALALDLPAPDPADDYPADDDGSLDVRWVGLDPRLVLEERGQVARRERRHRARLTVGLELEQRVEVRVDRLAERDLGHHEGAARNNGTGSATPFGPVGPSASAWSKTHSRSASNVSILHTVSRNL
jgi:hypothetical protein